MKILTPFLLIIAAAASAAQSPSAPPGAKPEEQSWSTRTYRFPAEELILGFPSKDRGELKAPPMPNKSAAEAEILSFLKSSNGILTQYFTALGTVPPEGSLLAFDPDSETLVARTTPTFQQFLKIRAEDAAKGRAALVHVNIHILEADAATVREHLRDAGSAAAQTKMFDALTALADQGKARHVTALRAETRSGQRVKLRSFESRSVDTTLTLRQNGTTLAEQEFADHGTVWEIDPVVGEDRRTIDINVALEHHFSPPLERWELLPGRLGGQKLECRVTDFSLSKITTALTMIDGTTKLLGVWNPENPAANAKGDVLQAAFCTAHLASLMPAETATAEQWLKTHGEKVIPTPKALPPPPEGVPAGMRLRLFRMPSSFLASLSTKPSSGATNPFLSATDPFAAGGEPKLTVRANAVEILRAAGIVFPEGASATFDPEQGHLLVRNTPENLDALSALVEDRQRDSAAKTLALTLHIVQAEGALLRRLMKETGGVTDHAAAWAAVEEAARQKKAEIIRSSWLESRSGQRAKFEAIRQSAHTVGGISLNANHTAAKTTSGDDAEKKLADATKPEKPTPGDATAPLAASATVEVSGGLDEIIVEPDMMDVGLAIEMDPVIGEDDRTIDLNWALTFDYAAPTKRSSLDVADANTIRTQIAGTDFHRAEMTLATSLIKNTWRLAGVWKPQGTAEFDGKDILQAAFIRVQVLKNPPPKP